tara:strand:- start:4 stop:741 length:738 start_codon:yes stop_codon:yes gene_type:complete
MSDAFDTAWEIAKADTGMWDEIYANLLAQTTGMGDLPSAPHFTDFVPTKIAREIIPPNENNSFLNPEGQNDEDYLEELKRNTGDHGWSVDRLADSIMEEGFDINHFIDRTGRMDPSFNANQKGLEAFEGRHRTLALDKLGAPYVPFSGKYDGHIEGRHKHPYSISPKFERDTKLVSNGGKASPWSLGGYLRRGRLELPLSYMYGREMVPGMGRLLPDVEDKNMNQEKHSITDKWFKTPSWKRVYD